MGPKSAGYRLNLQQGKNFVTPDNKHRRVLNLSVFIKVSALEWER